MQRTRKNAGSLDSRPTRIPAPASGPAPHASRLIIIMKMELRKSFQFEAAHLLPLLPKTHKCRRLHGHSFKVEIVVAGECDPKLGWLMDYADITAAFKPLWEKLDHRYLNEIPGLKNPTSEEIACW